jgi:16S rRNA (guanine1207-N2)-methyltransferase
LQNEIISRLLFDHVQFAAQERVLLYAPPDHYIVRDIAKRVNAVAVHETSYRAWLAMQRVTGHLPNVYDAEQFSDGIYPQPPMQVEKAIIISPKGRDYARGLLWSAYQVLVPGGHVLMIGGNNEGVKTVIKDAEALYGNSNLLAYKQRVRIATAQKTQPVAHHYPAAWGDDPTQVSTLDIEAPYGLLTLATLPGVFSWRKLDDGTRLLLQQQRLHDFAQGRSVLDVGCGNGVIGCVLGQVARSVLMVDDSKLACGCATLSAEYNNLHNAQIEPADVYSALENRDDAQVDLIVSNPPFHQGFNVQTSVARRIITAAPQHLAPGGRLLLVANAFLPYEKLLREHFSQVTQLANDNKYVVLEASG